MIYGGIDVGTTGAKITLFNGNVEVYQQYKSYLSSHSSNSHTIDASTIFDATKELINKAKKAYPDLCAVGITSFGETAVLLDERDNVLFPSLLYTDGHGELEAQEIEALVGKDKLGRITGQLGRSMYSLPKILSIRKENPEKFKLVKRICLIEDYLIYKFTGIAAIDYSLAARTLCFDIQKLEFSKEILDAVNIDINLFSRPVPTGTRIGKMKNECLDSAGDIEIVVGMHDQVANVIGSGIVESNCAADGNGTCECVAPVIEELPTNKLLYEKGFGVIPFVNKNFYLTYTLISTSGSLIEWVINTMFQDKKGEENLFEELNKEIKGEPRRIMVLPHFAGASTPYMDSNAMGGIVNLDLSSTRYDIYQATLESLCYEMLISLKDLRRAGFKIDKIVASGGGSVNEKWMQMKADVFGIPVYQNANKNAGTIGTAIVVGKEIGEFASYQEGIEKMVSYSKVFYPNKKKHALYMKQFKKYQRLYLKLKGVR